MDLAIDKSTAKNLKNKSLMYRLILINIENSHNVNKTKALV